VRTTSPAKDIDNVPALFWAFEIAEDPELFEAALKAGADPNIRTATGRPLICNAAFRPNPDFLEILLRYKADPNVSDRNGESPLSIILMNSSALINMPYTRQLDMLIHDSTEPNTLVQGEPALLWCIKYHQDWALKPLITAGANIQAKDSLGQTIYQLADGVQTRIINRIMAAEDN
jgi:ankyrin repeat protein